MDWSVFFENLKNFLNNLISFVKILSWKRILLVMGIIILFTIFLKYITWPRLTFALVILAIVAFYPNIAGLLDRVLKFGKDGIVFAQITQPSNILSEEKMNNSQSINELNSIQTINENITYIENYLSNKNINDPNQKVEKLIPELAVTYFNFQCTRIYSFIFGSQISLLNILAKDVSCLMQSDIDKYFENISNFHAEFYKNERWTSNSYMSFLIREKLIEFTENENYKITYIGKDFLTWLHKTGTPENKLY